MTQRTLTDLEKRILDFASEHDVAQLEQQGVHRRMVEAFGWRPVTFAQALYRLLDDPAAERERPMEVRRLRRLRDERRAARSRPFTRAG